MIAYEKKVIKFLIETRELKNLLEIRQILAILRNTFTLKTDSSFINRL